MSADEIKAERSADTGERIIEQHSDANVTRDEDTHHAFELDVSDVIADLHHLSDRYGGDFTAIIARAERSYQGDVAEGGGMAASRLLEQWGVES